MTSPMGRVVGFSIGNDPSGDYSPGVAADEQPIFARGNIVLAPQPTPQSVLVNEVVFEVLSIVGYFNGKKMEVSPQPSPANLLTGLPANGGMGFLPIPPSWGSLYFKAGGQVWKLLQSGDSHPGTGQSLEDVTNPNNPKKGGPVSFATFRSQYPDFVAD
jgi:hypothetical protein